MSDFWLGFLIAVAVVMYGVGLATFAWQLISYWADRAATRRTFPDQAARTPDPASSA